MSIDTLRHKVMDTLSVELLEQHLAKWQGRFCQAIESGTREELDKAEKMLSLFEKRLERARAAEGPGAAS